MTTWMLALLAFAADTAPITDEALRLEALRAVFPGMPVVAVPGKRVKTEKVDRNSDIQFPNALAGEQLYQATGKARNEVEHCASEDMLKQTFSSVREVAFRVYPWPRSTTDFAAVLQYDFSDASPALSCSSIGLITHLLRKANKLVVIEQVLLDPMHHWSLPQIRLVDLTGDGIDELVVESDGGGAEVASSTMHIYDLSRGRLNERAIAGVRNLIYRSGEEEESTFVLDVARSRTFAGAKFCFVKTRFMERMRKLTPPRVSNVCFGAGLDKDERRERKDLEEMLRPLPR